MLWEDKGLPVLVGGHQRPEDEHALVKGHALRRLQQQRRQRGGTAPRCHLPAAQLLPSAQCSHIQSKQKGMRRIAWERHMLLQVLALTCRKARGRTVVEIVLEVWQVCESVHIV